MDFYDVINARHTIRDFADEPIGGETIRRIIAAGLKAPTNDHMRDWHFVVVTDRAVTARLIEKIPARISDEEIGAILRDWSLRDECQQGMYRSAIPKQYRMLMDAACVVVPLLKQKTDVMHPGSLSDLNGFASIWCCIENMLLAATAEDCACALRIPLGQEAEWAREALGFPADYLMPCFLAVGRPAPDALCAPQKEYALDERIHENQW